MVTTCAMCGKKIGNLGNREYKFFNTNISICNGCSNQIEILTNRINNSKTLEDLDKRYDYVKNEINTKYNLSEKDKKIFVDEFLSIYKAKKDEFDNAERKIKSLELQKEKEKEKINTIQKINRFENDRKNKLKSENIDIDNILNIRESNSTLKNILSINDQYEYDVVVINDNRDGSIDATQLEKELVQHSVFGWRLKNLLTNELGKSATGIGINGVSADTNATIDQLILIFERKISKTNE